MPTLNVDGVSLQVRERGAGEAVLLLRAHIGRRGG